MRSGHFKQKFEDLVVLTDSVPVKAWSAALFIALCLLPVVAGPFLTAHMTTILIIMIGALGLNVLTGMTGLISLGHVAFLMIGAYSYAIGTNRFGLAPLLALGLAGAVPALAGLLVGVPSLRLKGLYLAITTLAFVFITNAVILAGGDFTGGSKGLPISRPVIFGWDLNTDSSLYWFCLLVGALVLGACLNLRRTYAGRAMMAIRDNDIAARSMGINLMRYKLVAFMISAFITGIAGALLAFYIGIVSVEGFPFLLSIEALAILIVGGMGSILGVVFGTVFIVSLPELVSVGFELVGGSWVDAMATRMHEVKSMLYGVAIIAFLRFDPRGLLGIWKDVRHLWVNWPLRY